ncbi:MAG: HEAT repeat domain-containing protein [Chromatiales bacterium]|nr:HEAT repeat domain-containing protein [Gammaproteobacteria bacterium]MBW6475514.1 HEAT repeat domain-containing protein [Chromatiales bacterium]
MHPPVNALLFTAPGCPHCPGVKAALEGLQREGKLGELTVMDISQDPAKAAEYGIRSVPWLQLGDFILTGAQTPSALRQWSERAASPDGMAGYLEHLLAGGELSEAEQLLARQPQHYPTLLALLKKADRPMQVGLGISAIIESLGQPELTTLLPDLLSLADEPDHRLRTDAAHYLGLLNNQAARAKLSLLRDDPHPEVREIAAEALD